MRLLKKFFAKLKNPGLAVTICALAFFAAALTGVILAIVFNASPYIAYVMYFLSALGLGYFIYLVVLFCKSAKPRFYAFAEKHAFLDRLVHDYPFRTMLFALGSFAVNAAYAVFNLVYGIFFRSYWYVAIAGYYIILSVMRGIIVLTDRRYKKLGLNGAELAEKNAVIYRNTGIMLLLLTVALNVVLWLMTGYGYGFYYRDMLIYVAATYTVVKMTLAVRNIVKVKKNDFDLSVGAVRNINVAAALMSLLALQTAMLSAFSEEGADYSLGTSALGTCICAFTFALGIYMIIKGIRTKKKLKANEELRG